MDHGAQATKTPLIPDGLIIKSGFSCFLLEAEIRVLIFFDPEKNISFRASE